MNKGDFIIQVQVGEVWKISQANFYDDFSTFEEAKERLDQIFRDFNSKYRIVRVEVVYQDE